MGAGASTPFENQEATPEAAVSALGEMEVKKLRRCC